MYVIYIDDILITRGSTEEIQALVSQLDATFSLKDPGDLHYFLSIEVVKTSDGLRLSQKCISYLLKRAEMDQANVA